MTQDEKRAAAVADARNWLEANTPLRWETELDPDGTGEPIEVLNRRPQKWAERLADFATAKVAEAVAAERAETDRLTAENAALKAERRWIPVEERLPDKIGDVLVTTPDRVVRKVYFWHGDRRFDFKGRDAIAWMPLPEPYNPDLAVLDELTEIRLKLR